MEAASAGEWKDRSFDGAASLFDLCLGLLKIAAVKDNQRAAIFSGSGRLCFIEATVEPFVIEGGIFSAVIDKLPAECRSEECFACVDVS